MSNKVTFAEIIEALARKTGLSKQKSEAFAKALITEVKAELQETGKASITNFGSFKVKEVAERQGQNPQTGEPITIPAHKRVTFTPYKALREEVNAKYAHLESELIGEKKEKGKQEPKSEAAPNIFEETERSEANFEPEPDIEEDEIVEEAPKSFNRRERVRGNNTGLIMVGVLVLVMIGLASAWFLLSTDDEPEQTMMSTTVQTEQEANTQEEPETEVPAEAVEDEPSQDEMAEEQETASGETEATQNPETVEQTPSETVINGRVYQVNEDEWYWVIAEKVYGKSRFWPLIFQENRSPEDDPDELYPSSGLDVPAMEGTGESPSKGDYQRLSEASMVVAEAYRNAGKTAKADEYERFSKWWVTLSR